jgi:hypothetical protein
MPKPKVARKGKFKIKVTRANGHSSDVSGELNERGEHFMNFVVCILSAGEAAYPGLTAALDGYIDEVREHDKQSA